VTNEPVAVFGGPLLQIVDECFDQIPFGLLQDRGSAVISRIGLDEIGVELVLADQQAETVAEAMLSVMVTVISGRDGIVLFGSDQLCRARGPAKFFDRTEANAVGLAESAVDGTGFSDAHFGAADQGGDVGRIGIAIADEAARLGRLVYNCSENPPVGSCVTQLPHPEHSYSAAAITVSKA